MPSTDTLDPALEASLDPKALEAALRGRPFGEDSTLTVLDFCNGYGDEAAHKTIVAAVRAYLAAASPQAEIDRLREAFKEAASIAQDCPGIAKPTWSNVDPFWAGVAAAKVAIYAALIARALHPETPNGGSNG